MPVEIFCCYARKDHQLLNRLKSHLMPLVRKGFTTLWADTDINAGTEWEREIDKHLNTADIILLLVSPNFMASDYCYSIEMKRAIERHEQGEAIVIPVILRPVYWQGAPFGKLEALPTDSKPVMLWSRPDQAFFSVVDGIRSTVETLISKRVELWIDKGWAYLRDGRYNEAQVALKKALELDPDNHDANSRVNFVEALKELERLNELTENEELEQIRQAYGL